MVSYPTAVIAKPSTVTDELARYLFMWVALIGAALYNGSETPSCHRPAYDEVDWQT